MNNLTIIDKTNSENFVPFECPVCLTVMRDQMDAFSYSDYECCSLCVDDVIFPNKEKWDDGWRPSNKIRQSMRKKRLELPSYYAKM